MLGYRMHDCTYKLNTFSKRADRDQKQLLLYSSDAVVKLARAYKPIKDRINEVITVPYPGQTYRYDHYFKEQDIEQLANVLWGMNLMSTLLASAQIVKQLKPRFQRYDFAHVPAISYQDLISQLKDKTTMTKEQFEALSDLEKLVAFTVAKVGSMELLERVQASLGNAIKEGNTFVQWRKDIAKEYEAAGVELSKPWHLETIYQTNIFSARMRGKAQTIAQFHDHIAFLRFVWMHTAPDASGVYHCICNQLDGLTAAPDDPIWRTHFPLIHYRCHCDMDLIWKDKATGIQKSKTEGLPRPEEGFRTSPLELQAIKEIMAKAPDYGIPVDAEKIQELLKIITGG